MQTKFEVGDVVFFFNTNDNYMSTGKIHRISISESKTVSYSIFGGVSDGRPLDDRSRWYDNVPESVIGKTRKEAALIHYKEKLRRLKESERDIMRLIADWEESP